MFNRCPKCGYDYNESGDSAHVCGPVEVKQPTKITAQEARELAGPTVQERVDEVYPLIREAATEGKRSIALHKWWANEGYSGSKDYKQACKILEGEGYKVSFFYEERQFVDMYTVVEW